MIRSCVHTHTTFCDGCDTVLEMAENAYSLKLKAIGFSGHSYVAGDDFGIKSEDMHIYRAEVKRVKEIYSGKIDVLCGIELDSFTPKGFDLTGLDYIIGSAHQVMGDDGAEYIIDGSHERLVDAATAGFGGDYIKLYTAYYNQFVRFLTEVNPDIIGHFDLITKFNELYCVFDDKCNAYKEVAISAIDKALELDRVIEVNTGAITRGHRTLPYPSDFLLKRILQKKGKVIITTDAHSVSTLVYWTNEAEEYLKTLGFKTVCELGSNGLYERTL